MALRKIEVVKQIEVQRPERAKLTYEEALRRMQEFAARRKEQLVATVRKRKS